MNPRHLSKSNEWYTPPEVVDRARDALDGIYLDPASCEFAQLTVRAIKWYSKEENGLSRPWSGAVFLNPPGGRKPGAATWLYVLVQEYDAGRVSRAVFVGFSLEILQTMQTRGIDPAKFTLCIPKKRIAYVSPSGAKRSPPHGSVILGLGTGDRFAKAFRSLGAIS